MHFVLRVMDQGRGLVGTSDCSVPVLRQREARPYLFRPAVCLVCSFTENVYTRDL